MKLLRRALFVGISAIMVVGGSAISANASAIQSPTGTVSHHVESPQTAQSVSKAGSGDPATVRASDVSCSGVGGTIEYSPVYDDESPYDLLSVNWTIDAGSYSCPETFGGMTLEIDVVGDGPGQQPLTEVSCQNCDTLNYPAGQYLCGGEYCSGDWYVLLTTIYQAPSGETFSGTLPAGCTLSTDQTTETCVESGAPVDIPLNNPEEDSIG